MGSTARSYSDHICSFHFKPMSDESRAPQPAAEHRLLRRREVEHRTGFKRAYIYQLIKTGKFPKGRRIGVRAVGWDSAEIEQWIAQRPQT